jgi:hypothetical protein
MQLHAANLRGTFPSTPPKNDGAGYAESDDNGVSTEDDDDDEFDTEFEQECNEPLTLISNRKVWRRFRTGIQ